MKSWYLIQLHHPSLGPRLDEMDETEWWDVCRRLCPDVTRADFERHWQEFQAMKRARMAS